MPKLNRKKFFILACLLVLTLKIGLTASLPTAKYTLVAEVKAQAPDRPYLIGWYSYANRPGELANLAANGTSIVLMYGGDSSAGTVNNYLNEAQGRGIKVISGLNNLTDDAQASPETIVQRISGYMNHPALYGWYISDEPAYQGTSASYLEQVYNAIKNVDPNHIATQVHYSRPASQYVNSIDMLMIDWYPGWEGSLSQEFDSLIRRSYSIWKSGVDWVKANGKQGFIATPQGFGAPHGPGRTMTYAEYRFHILSAVVLDTDAVIFYKETWADGEARASIERIMHQVQSVGSEMNNGTTNDSRVSVSESPDRLVYRYGVNGSRQAILAVNIANHNISNSGAQLNNIQFTLPAGVRPSQIEVVDENRTLPVTNGTFTDTFSRFEVHIYAFESGDGGPSPSPSPSSSCLADINNDNTVNVADIVQILQAWGSCPGCAEDVDGNGFVNVADIISVLQAWGKCG